MGSHTCIPIPYVVHHATLLSTTSYKNLLHFPSILIQKKNSTLYSFISMCLPPPYYSSPLPLPSIQSKHFICWCRCISHTRNHYLHPPSFLSLLFVAFPLCLLDLALTLYKSKDTPAFREGVLCVSLFLPAPYYIYDGKGESSFCLSP